MSRYSVLAAMALHFAFIAATSAAPIASYTFDTVAGDPPATGYAATTVDPNVTVTQIIAGNGLLGTGVINISSPGAYPTAPVLQVAPDGGTTLTSSIAGDDYFEFTVTPDLGTTLNLTSLTIDAAKGGGSSNRGFAVFSSELGFAEANAIFSDTDVNSLRSTFTPYFVDLSGPQFQGITGPTTFRINVFTPAVGNTLEFDNLLLSGTTAAVPEPVNIVQWLMLGILFSTAATWRGLRSRRS